MSNAQSGDVMSVISEVVSPLEVSPDSSFDDLEASSVLLLRLMVALQRRFDVVLDVVDMFSVDDVNDLVRLVEERMPRERARSNVTPVADRRTVQVTAEPKTYGS